LLATTGWTEMGRDWARDVVRCRIRILCRASHSCYSNIATLPAVPLSLSRPPLILLSPLTQWGGRVPRGDRHLPLPWVSCRLLLRSAPPKDEVRPASYGGWLGQPILTKNKPRRQQAAAWRQPHRTRRGRQQVTMTRSLQRRQKERIVDAGETDGHVASRQGADRKATVTTSHLTIPRTRPSQSP